MKETMNGKARTISFLVVILLISTGFGKDKDKDAQVTLHGAIMDSQCAYNVHSDTHSHDWMTKRGVQGANNEESCTNHCVKDMGGSYVLVVQKEAYKIDDQLQPEQFAGKKVKVTGTVDAKTHTLHLFSIEEDK